MVSPSMAHVGPSITVSVGGGASVEGFASHIHSIIGKKPIQVCSLKNSKVGRVNGQVQLKALPKYTPQVLKEYAACLRKSKLNNHTVHASVDKISRSKVAGTKTEPTERKGNVFGRKRVLAVSMSFLEWLTNEDSSCIPPSFELRKVNRATLSTLFESFCTDCESDAVPTMSRRQTRSMEFLVVLCLKEQKLCRQKKSNGKVSYSFVQNKKGAPMSKSRENPKAKEEDEGIDVSLEPHIDGGEEIVCNGRSIEISYRIHVQKKAKLPVKLSDVRIGGRDGRFFRCLASVPVQLGHGEVFVLPFSFDSKGSALRRSGISLCFEIANRKAITINRSIVLRTGDSGLYDILKPKTEFQKKRPVKEKTVKNTLSPRKPNGVGPNISNQLQFFDPPKELKQQLLKGQLETSLINPSYHMDEDVFRSRYCEFWQNMIWANELQALEDVKTFDMQHVALKRNGRNFKLIVPGLAEGRPSVLKGDSVSCHWKGINYKGRVEAVHLQDVDMAFHDSFHRHFDERIDRIEQVRFTFSRLPFRTCHDGVRKASQALGQQMLYPTKEHFKALLASRHGRRSSQDHVPWNINRDPNSEQQEAISRIVKGEARPMPYILFGPPGTGYENYLTCNLFIPTFCLSSSSISSLEKQPPSQKPSANWHCLVAQAG